MLLFSYIKISTTFHKLYFDKYLALLPGYFKDRINKFKRWQDAQSSLLGYLLITKYLLSEDVSMLILLKYNKFGKPFLEGKPFFNVSHSGDYVVFTSCLTNKIGVDIEIIDTDNQLLVEDFFFQMTESEKSTIQNSSQKKDSFYSYWTQKEAVMKANGAGLSIPLKSFEVFDAKTTVNNEVYHLKEIFINASYKCHISSTMDLSKIKIVPEEMRLISL